MKKKKKERGGVKRAQVTKGSTRQLEGPGMEV